MVSHCFFSAEISFVLIFRKGFPAYGHLVCRYGTGNAAGRCFHDGRRGPAPGQSPIIGYLLTGIIVGPPLFNTALVNQASELGVALLLFSIGLEFSFKQLMKMGRMAFGGGTLQVVLTILTVSLITVNMFDLPRALTLGAIVAMSSTTMVLRLLVDRVEIDSVKGRTCLAILLLQDIAIVPLVLMVSFFTPAASEINIGLHILKVSLSVIGLAVVFYLLLYHLAPVLLSEAKLFANRELTVLLSITVGFGAAWAAHKLHISPALGAFVAGMLLGESPFATQIRSDIGSMRIIMVTLFFSSVGMQAKPIWFIKHLHWVALVSVIVLILKIWDYLYCGPFIQPRKSTSPCHGHYYESDRRVFICAGSHCPQGRCASS